MVFGTAVLGAVLLWLALAAGGTAIARSPSHGTLFGVWQVLYNTQAPPVRVLLAAAGMALIFAAGVGYLERRIATGARRDLDPSYSPLAPRVVMQRTRGIYAGPVTVTVLIPAHNEESCIGDTIDSLLGQSHRPSRILVVADNCTDETVELARRRGVDVMETVDNADKKAGALNQALSTVLPGQGDNDVVMVMDADTVLDDGFLECAVQRFTADRALMAVGGLFYGAAGSGMIGQFQRNEYTRYAREISRRRGRVFVLTGTASMFRPHALRTIAVERGHTLPGNPGDVYDTLVLTEDNELTLALKTLGALMTSPSECTVVTEVMPTWQALWNQRLRWQRGALENLGSYGVRPRTFRYWAQQLGIGYGVLALSAYLGLIGLMIACSNHWVWFPFWIGLGLIFVLERLVAVWHSDWSAKVLALTLFPELVFAMFLNVVYIKGIVDISFQRKAQWRHVVPERRAELAQRK